MSTEQKLGDVGSLQVTLDFKTCEAYLTFKINSDDDVKAKENSLFVFGVKTLLDRLKGNGADLKKVLRVVMENIQ